MLDRRVVSDYLPCRAAEYWPSLYSRCEDTPTRRGEIERNERQWFTIRVTSFEPPTTAEPAPPHLCRRYVDCALAYHWWRHCAASDELACGRRKGAPKRSLNDLIADLVGHFEEKEKRRWNCAVIKRRRVLRGRLWINRVTDCANR